MDDTLNRVRQIQSTAPDTSVALQAPKHGATQPAKMDNVLAESGPSSTHRGSNIARPTTSVDNGQTLSGETLQQSGPSRLPIKVPRTEGLGSHSSIAELMQTGALPGVEGVITTDRHIRFGDIYKLSTLGGRKFEFSLARRTIDGNPVNVLYSGEQFRSPVPPDGHVVAHTHPNETPSQKWPSEGDMDTVNKHFFRDNDTNPTQPKPSRVIWGEGDLENTIFYPGFGKDPKLP